MDLISIAFDAIPVANRLDDRHEFRDQVGRYRPLVTTSLGAHKSGDCFKMVDPDGNRVIVIVTPVGNVVVREYQRDTDTVLVDAPEAIQGLLGRGAIGDDRLVSILGLWGNQNIGSVLATLMVQGGAQQ